MGARSVLAGLGDKQDRFSRWARTLVERRGYWKAAVAIAAKNLRLAWAVMKYGEDFRLTADPSLTLSRHIFDRHLAVVRVFGGQVAKSLAYRSINIITYYATSRSNFFQRKTTGVAFISSIPFRMRALSSWIEATRIWRRKVWAIFEKAHSIKLSQEPCLGV